MTETFLDLLYAEAPREAFEQLVEAAEAGGDPARAALLRDALPRALQVRDTLERQRKRGVQLSALYATAGDLTAIRDLDAILTTIVRRARQLLDTDITYLGLNDEADGAAWIRVTDGSVSDSFANLRLPFGTGLLGLVASSGQPYATPDYHHDERFQHRGYIDEAVDDESIRAILGVPMRVGDKVIGALMAANRTPRPFPAEEVELLSTFAAHAAIALENARLFGEAVEAQQRLREHSASVETAAAVHDQLTRVLLEQGGVDDVAAVIAGVLDARVQVLDPERGILADTGSGPGLDASAIAEAINASRLTGHVAGLAGGHVVVASGGSEVLGALVVLDREELTLAERRTVERAAMVASLMLLFARTVASAEDRVREELLADVLADPPHDPTRLRERGRRQGLDLDEPAVVLAVDVHAASAAGVLAAARRFAASGNGLVTARSDELVVLIPGSEGMAVARRLHEALGHVGQQGQQGQHGQQGQNSEPVTVGVAVSSGGTASVLAAYREARQCRRSLRALGRGGEVADATTTGSAHLLLGDSGPDQVRAFIETTLGPLLAYDAKRGSELVATVEAWFHHEGSTSAVAAAMQVHPNTVGQRLERVQVLLGDDWRSPARALDLRLALQVRRLQHLQPAD